MDAAATLLTETAPAAGAAMRLRLRDATALLHRRVEHHINLMNRAWTAQTYVLLLRAMRGIHAPLERGLASLDWSGTTIAMRERRKTPWLDSDLGHYGFDAEAIAAIAECGDLPKCECISAGLGVLYVLEGSTLGGQVILRSLRQQLGISAEAGGRFFSAYGTMTGSRWRGYLAELERAGGSPRDAAAIERAATQTFAAFDRWMAQAGLAHDE